LKTLLNTVSRTLRLTFLAFALTLPFPVMLSSSSQAAINGYFYGMALGVVNFMFLALGLARAVRFGSAFAQVVVTAHYFLRYTAIFVALWYALKNPRLDFTASVIGFLLINVVILIDNIKKRR
jgi:hypothetical protein